MDLLTMNDSILSKDKTPITIETPTQEQLKLFKRLVLTSARVKDVYEHTDDAGAFFSVFPDIKRIVGGKVSIECFYAYKNRYLMSGVPAKLVYVLWKALQGDGKLFPNKSLCSAINLIKPYTSMSFDYAGESYTVKDVIDNIAGYSVNLLSHSMYKVLNNGTYEVYISNVNEVALLPDDIAGVLSQEDCKSISYDSGIGLLLHDVPIRTLCNRIGITRDDLDLRACL